MHLSDIREFVVLPALARIGLIGENRAQLVLGTGNVESRYNYLDQTTPGPGPAYGFWQMEKATHDDIWVNWINYQPTALRDVLFTLAGVKYAPPPVTVMHWNLQYAAAMCALHYRRVPAKLPEADDVPAMAGYWKQWYNTPHGKGTIEKALPFFREAVFL